MNETVSKWIIEFLLRQTINDKIINGVLSCLPLSNDDIRLKKTILLRNLELEVSNGSVHEKLLEFLEIIEELDHRKRKKASILMREAYCLVAVDCTVRFLDDEMEDNSKYFEKVEKVWKNRVCKMKGLASEGLKRWLDDIETATKDSSVCERICATNTRNEALKAVKAYVKEAWKCMGPPFLELVAMKVGDEVQEFFRGVDLDNLGCNLVSTLGMQDGQASAGRKHGCGKHIVTRPTRIIRRPRGAIIYDPEESVNVANDDPTSIKDKVQETHKSDCVQLHNGVNESHHLDASQADHDLSSTKAKESTSNVGAVKNTTVPDANVTREVDAAVTDPLPDVQNLSFTQANESRSNVDAAKNITVPVIRASSEANRVQVAFDSSSREQHAAVTDPLSEAPNLPSTKAKDSMCNMDAAKKKTVPVRHVTPEVNRVQEALRTSCRELHEAVTDPLPEALEVAAALSRKGEIGNHETNVANKVHAAAQNPTSDASRPAQNVSSKMVTNNTSNDLALANQTQDVPRDSTDKNVEYMDKTDGKHDGNVQGNGAHDPQLKRKRSLMEPNGTGHTLEWEDSIDNSSADSPPEGPRLRSNSSRDRPFPLRAYAGATKFGVKFTPREDEALKEGIRRFGLFQWSDIVQASDGILKGRTRKALYDRFMYLKKRNGL